MPEVIEGVLSALALGVTLVAGAVIALTLYLLVQTLVVQQRRAFGVEKAVGFTSGQLIAQVGWTYLPAVTLGVALGTVGGTLGFQPAIGLLLRWMGIGAVFLDVPVLVSTALALGLIGFAAAVTVLVASSVRRVSAYQLVTE